MRPFTSRRVPCVAQRSVLPVDHDYTSSLMSVRGRPPVVYVAWMPHGERAREIAEALGGETACFYFRGLRGRATTPIRYVVDAVRTALWLCSRRPRSVIATNPPIFPALIALAWCRMVRAPLVLDSHPSAFGLAGDSVSRWMLPVHAWLARRSAATLVTCPALASVVEGWGGRAEVLHEAEPAWAAVPARPAPARPRVLFAGTFSGDEPVAEVVEAARIVSDVDVMITGDLRRCPDQLRRDTPANVDWLGFLSPDDYVAVLRGADAVLALSTEDTSVMRTACEAVWAERPLIVSDWPYLWEVFPSAVHVRNDREGIAGGLRLVLTRYGELLASAPGARSQQVARWREQLRTLESALDSVNAPSGDRPREPARRRRSTAATANGSRPTPHRRRYHPRS